MPDDHRALLYRPVESLGDAIRTDDLETAKRHRDQLNLFFVAPYATTGEPLGDAVAELYKVSGWGLRNFHGRPEHKQQALQSTSGLTDWNAWVQVLKEGDAQAYRTWVVLPTHPNTW